MGTAQILFHNTDSKVTLEFLKEKLDGLGIRSSHGEWRFMTTTVPQLELHTDPPISLQLNSRADVVQEEAAELLDGGWADFPQNDWPAIRKCDARIEVASGEQPVIGQTDEGGTISYTPEPDLASPETKATLQRIAAVVEGWLWFEE